MYSNLYLVASSYIHMEWRVWNKFHPYRTQDQEESQKEDPLARQVWLERECRRNRNIWDWGREWKRAACCWWPLRDHWWVVELSVLLPSLSRSLVLRIHHSSGLRLGPVDGVVTLQPQKRIFTDKNRNLLRSCLTSSSSLSLSSPSSELLRYVSFRFNFAIRWSDSVIFVREMFLSLFLEIHLSRGSLSA